MVTITRTDRCGKRAQQWIDSLSESDRAELFGIVSDTTRSIPARRSLANDWARDHGHSREAVSLSVIFDQFAPAEVY